MKVLGVHSYGHDTSASLIIDKKIVCAIEEERLSRNKHETGMPLKSVSWCLDFANLKINEIG